VKQQVRAMKIKIDAQNSDTQNGHQQQVSGPHFINLVQETQKPLTTKLWRLWSLLQDHNKERCMKQFILVLAGLALVTSAQAADTTEFKWDAELRTRYTNDSGYNFQKKTQEEAGAGGQSNAGRVYNYFQTRTKLGLGMSKGEKLAGHVGFINNFNWGSAPARGYSITSTANAYNYANPTTVNTTNTDTQALLVNEAWGWWKAHDLFSVKVGRSQMEVAGGAVIGNYDWRAVPYAYDGMWFNFDFEPVYVNLYGAKLLDLNASGAAYTTGGTAAQNTNDPETVMYGMTLGFKTLPDFFKKAEIHLMQVNDETSPATNPSTAQNTGATLDRTEFLRYGLFLNGDVSNFDYTAVADIHNGVRKWGATGQSDLNLKGSMYDLGLGYTLPEVMMLRFGARYHMDSGGQVTGTDDSNYKTVGYDQHKWGGGEMDVVDWGNVTFWGLDAGIQPMDDVAFKLAYTNYTRTSNSAAVKINGTSWATGATDASSSSSIGSEIDFTATKNYGDMSIWALYGVFTPGDYIQKTTANASTPQTDSHTRIQLQAKWMF